MHDRACLRATLRNGRNMDCATGHVAPVACRPLHVARCTATRCILLQQHLLLERRRAKVHELRRERNRRDRRLVRLPCAANAIALHGCCDGGHLHECVRLRARRWVQAKRLRLRVRGGRALANPAKEISRGSAGGTCRRRRRTSCARSQSTSHPSPTSAPTTTVRDTCCQQQTLCGRMLWPHKPAPCIASA